MLSRRRGGTRRASARPRTTRIWATCAWYHAKAAKFYRLAAEQGNPQAQYNLALWYAEGDGGAPDLVAAHMWFNLAAARFPASDSRGRSSAMSSRDAVALQIRLLPRSRKHSGSHVSGNRNDAADAACHRHARACPIGANFRPPDIADFRDWNHGRFAIGGAHQYLSAFLILGGVTT